MDRPPNSMFFPVGCVMMVGGDVWPVLDPECVCKPQRCCLRAHCACFWEGFFVKALDAIRQGKHFTARHKLRVLRVVSEENPQVVLGQFERDVKGRIQWHDWYTLK